MTGGKFQVANIADFSDAVTIAIVQETPTEGVLTKLTAPSGTTKRYRYLRYIGPDNGSCNVAEVQFYGQKVDETEVGIEEVKKERDKDEKWVGAIYDMSGRRVQLPTSGMYIVNCRKVIIK